MKNKNIKSFVVSDCKDENAVGRYVASFGRELGGQVHCVGIENIYEASGCAIDIIDELQGSEAVVFVNVAPRRNDIKSEGNKNGRPFYYFFVKKTLVITSSEKEIFQLFGKVGINFSKLYEINLFEEKGVPSNTQFRSAQCIPIVARKIIAKKGKHKLVKNFDIGTMKDCVWYIDNFGNCKTTLTEFTNKVNLEKIANLANVKDNQSAQTLGSSGFGGKRFVEFVIGGCKSYAGKNKIVVGQEI